VAGFWLESWHGLIAPVAFAISLFRDSVGVYEVHNSGAWYDLDDRAALVRELGLSERLGFPLRPNLRALLRAL
jgi:hypothetical protein